MGRVLELPTGDDREWRECWRLAVNHYLEIEGEHQGMARALAACEGPAKERWTALMAAPARSVQIQMDRTLTDSEHDLLQIALDQAWRTWLTAANELLIRCLHEDLMRHLGR